MNKVTMNTWAFCLLWAVLFSTNSIGQITPGTGNILFVNQAVSGGNNSGDSWNNAIPALRDALSWAKTHEADFAGNPLQIWVAKSIYTPTNGNDRAVSFEMVNNVAIYGGFSGTESNLSNRDWVANPTVLSGDLLGNDGTNFTNYEENSYHVISNENNGLNETAVLDGFIIYGGNAEDSGAPGDISNLNNRGGGIYQVSSSPAIINVTVASNRANTFGGGMYFSSSNSSLINLTITDNTSGSHGGGIYLSASSPIATNLTFTRNHSRRGGGLFMFSSSSTFENSTFKNNSAELGGAMFLQNSDPELTNTIVQSNNATLNGGGVYNFGGTATFTKSLFAGNTAQSGGGIYNEKASPNLINSTVSLNNATEHGGGIYNYTSNPVSKGIIISGNSAGGSGGGILNYISNPITTNILIANNTADWGGGMLNYASNPTLTNVTITGNEANNPGGAIYNQNGGGVVSTPTIYNSILLGNNSGIQNEPGSGSGPLSSNNLIQIGDASTGGSPDGTGSAIANTTISDIFTNFSSDDYTLKSGSYAVEAGDNANYNLVGDLGNDADLAGNERLAGVNIDLGPYEFGSSVLPIQLVFFEVSSHNADALLRWSTQTESNNKGFYIEHSTDAENWSSLTFVSSKADGGNSQSPNEYEYSDINPGNGQHFYRLKQTDLDGQYSYSEVRTATFSNHKRFSIYPNPAESQITINELGNGSYKLILTNVAGQALRQYKVDSQDRFRMNISDLPRGVYYLQVFDDSKLIESTKVVKQ